MSSPTVDTFEHDIANEIRNKEASITDIAAAVGDIGNTEPLPTHTGSALVSVVVILILSGIAGVGYLLYLYANGGSIEQQTATKTTTTIPSSEKSIPTSQIESLSPSLSKNIGPFLTNVQKTNFGYTITITSYSPVFAYMIRNENDFGEELGKALGNSHITKNKGATTTQILVTGTPQTIPATSTLTTSSSTASSTDTGESLPNTYIFSDLTISNQNMRSATSLYGTVVYAFIGTQKLVISSSTEGILALRNNILHK